MYPPRSKDRLDFLRGEPGPVVMGDFLDDATLRRFWTWVCTRHVFGAVGCNQVGSKRTQRSCRQYLR